MSVQCKNCKFGQKEDKTKLICTRWKNRDYVSAKQRMCEGYIKKD